MNHRAHIDGLRAIAVLAPVLFRDGTSWLTGGSIGVDVFGILPLDWRSLPAPHFRVVPCL